MAIARKHEHPGTVSLVNLAIGAFFFQRNQAPCSGELVLNAGRHAAVCAGWQPSSHRNHGHSQNAGRKWSSHLPSHHRSLSVAVRLILETLLSPSSASSSRTAIPHRTRDV